MANNEEVKTQSTEKTENLASTTEKVAEVKKTNKPVKNDKKTKKVKEKKTGAVSKTMSELKKVTWPKFGTVVKQTGVVIVVVLAFLLVIFGLDRLCSWLIGLICS